MTSTGWTRDSQMRYLNAFPLPKDFKWPHRDGGEMPVHPRHNQVVGYGKWLRETPYYIGLFELSCELVARWPGKAPPSPDELAGVLRKLRQIHAEIWAGLVPKPPLAHYLLAQITPLDDNLTLL